MIDQDSEHVSWSLDRIKDINQSSDPNLWHYGLVYQAHPRFIMHAVVEVLNELDTVNNSIA